MTPRQAQVSRNRVGASSMVPLPSPGPRSEGGVGLPVPGGFGGGRALRVALLSLVVGWGVPGMLMAADPAFAPPVAPPSPPPPTWREVPGPGVPWRKAAAGAYSIGEPTDEEQLYVEFINRARADPQGEVQRLLDGSDPDVEGAMDFFEVDRGVVLAQFAGIAPAPPVSIHPRLTTAARLHSEDMLANEFQGHDSSDGRTTDARIEGAGYAWTAYGENVYASAKGVWHGHAGFEIDWGLGPSGIQDPPGHRNTIHNPLYREVGVGVVLGSNGSVGPQLVTQNFANRSGLTPFITGVVYYDLNGNRFYDLGEGMGGVTVRVDGHTAYAVTARSGGYSVPVPGNGAYTVRFAVPGLADVATPVTVASGVNVKADHTPVYVPPTLGGTTVAYLGRDNVWRISPVGGATAYEGQAFRRLPWSAPEGAEDGLGRLVADVSPGYTPTSTGVRRSGQASFHLAHPQPPRNQYLTLHRPIRLGVASELRFFSRLRLAAPPQVARVQISTDAGVTWEDLWSQAGTGDSGDASFVEQRRSLAAYAGRSVVLRWAYTFTSGSYFPQTSDQVGWFIDDIDVSGAEELAEDTVAPTVAGDELRFRPTELGLYLLQVRARLGDRVLPWGNPLGVTVQDGGPVPPRLRLTSGLAGDGGVLEIGAVVEEGTAGVLELESAPGPEGPWAVEPGATLEPGEGAGAYRVRVAVVPGGVRFFRVVAR